MGHTFLCVFVSLWCDRQRSELLTHRQVSDSSFLSYDTSSVRTATYLFEANNMLLDRILERNRNYVESDAKQIPTSEDFKRIGLLYCMDPRLTGVVEPAMGFAPGEVVVLRNAGNQVLPESRDVLRSIAMSVLHQGLTDFIVLGHTDCGMSKFDETETVQRLEQEGVDPEEATGDKKIAEWFGAVDDIEENVRKTIWAIRACPLISDKLNLHGMIIDTKTGALRKVDMS